MTVAEWLSEATKELQKAGIPTARLDAELLLSHTLRKPRTYLHAHGDQELDDRQRDIAEARLELRLDYTPVAYIIGHKEFYRRRFKTTPAALIPRPESEAIIELLKTIMPTTLPLVKEKKYLIDVGTGTGALGITAKLEWPELDVTISDISQHALNLARENAKLLHAEVHFHKGDLLRGYGAPADIILANLPYVDRTWDVSPDTHAEPELALYATDSGLALIKQLIGQAAQLLRAGGSLLLESDERQQAAIIQFATSHGLKHRTTLGLITHFTKN
jgi:release factor glutamine methyltransferase